MTRPLLLAILGATVLGLPAAPVRAQDGTRPLLDRLDAIESGLIEVERVFRSGDTATARAGVTRLYLDEFEPVEGWWGPNGPLAAEPLSTRVEVAEAAFHALMSATGAEAPAHLADLRGRLEGIRAAAETTGASLDPAVARATAAVPSGERGIRPEDARSPEIEDLLRQFAEARETWRAGNAARAVQRIEHAYLEGFEPLEPRLPADRVGEIERAIHLVLRPSLARDAPAEEIEAGFDTVETSLLAVDESLAEGGSFWFTAVSAFAIIVREGLEAVLLIGAILAYLSRVTADPRHRRHVWAGVAAGVAASLATWVVARTLIPVGGASRELIEGITALLAVGVLLYVSHWLFQKTYLHDWKEYLRTRVGAAVTTGSGLAMAGLAFAAVYREGFETVLFYQALLFDAGPLAVVAGFVPGLVLIVGVGAGILRVGLKLPLKKVFAATNAILLYLAFVFLGKGLYNLQEAGLFAPRPMSWVPDHEALRQLFGLYPIAETLIAQAAFLGLLATTYFVYRSRLRDRGPSDPTTSAPEGRRPLRQESAPAP